MLQQKIGYIDLYKGGVKCGNMGHVKLEWQSGRYRFDANICRMDRQTIVTAAVERGGQSGDMRVKDIPIIHGKGQYQSDWLKVYGDEKRILFEASGGIYGVCALPEMESAESAVKDEKPQESADLSEHTPVREQKKETSDMKSVRLREEEASKASEEEPARLTAMENAESAVKDEKPQESADLSDHTAVREQKKKASEEESARLTEKETPDMKSARPQEKDSADLQAPALQKDRDPSKEEKEQQRKKVFAEEIPLQEEAQRASTLSDDKWKQLCSMYEVVHPIDAEIEFLKITPQDFVILRQEFQGLVRNSFLLHGYYNYNYILLGKYPDKYYIGVPGIMHEQERIAAAMFGFVGFERAGRMHGQGRKNDNFRYYMMEVGI